MADSFPRASCYFTTWTPESTNFITTQGGPRTHVLHNACQTGGRFCNSCGVELIANSSIRRRLWLIWRQVVKSTPAACVAPIRQSLRFDDSRQCWEVFGWSTLLGVEKSICWMTRPRELARKFYRGACPSSLNEKGCSGCRLIMSAFFERETRVSILLNVSSTCSASLHPVSFMKTVSFLEVQPTLPNTRGQKKGTRKIGYWYTFAQTNEFNCHRFKKLLGFIDVAVCAEQKEARVIRVMFFFSFKFIHVGLHIERQADSEKWHLKIHLYLNILILEQLLWINESLCKHCSWNCMPWQNQQ